MIALGPIALVAATLLGYSSNPVQISQCSLEATFIPVTYGDVFAQQAAGSQIHIRFTNVSPMPIASVTFDVAVDGKHRTIVDAGNFAQGVPIEHYFAQTDLQSGDASCHALAVRFKDGSFAPMD